MIWKGVVAPSPRGKHNPRSAMEAGVRLPALDVGRTGYTNSWNVCCGIELGPSSWDAVLSCPVIGVVWRGADLLIFIHDGVVMCVERKRNECCVVLLWWLMQKSANFGRFDCSLWAEYK